MQKCSRCQKTKETSSFHKGTNNGHSSYCKQCASEYNKEKINRKKKRLYSDSKEMECRSCGIIKKKSEYPKGRYSCRRCLAYQAFVRNINKKYNISYEDYKNMHDSQGNACAICLTKEKLLVDHDHSCCSGPVSCGKCVRALVCFRCNVSLGMVNDNVTILDSMIKYLKKY